MTGNSPRETKALWIFVSVVLGLPVLYWILFQFAAKAGVDLSGGVSGTLRSYGPAVAGVVALYYLGGKPALKKLWANLIDWRISGRLYAFAFLLPMSMMLAAVSVAFWLEPDTFQTGDVNYLKLVAILFILPIFDGPLGEEPGWRGYFLPALMARYHAITSSFLLALVWYLWHLPHYHIDGRTNSEGFFWKYLLFTFAISLMHTWLFKKAEGKVLIHVIFHNMTNYVVLLGFTLFPALEGTRIDNEVYFMLIMLAGGVAAWSLRHKT